jgi:chorismate dehydratase
MTVRIGYINYLNCYPFYYHMFEKEPVSGIEVVPGYPSHLNAGVSNGTLAMSPISAAAFADFQERTLMLSDFCLSSIGYVQSVILKSACPIEELAGKRVGVSMASKTSENLLKILLKKFYGIEPQYVQVPPQPDLASVDAALIIGNEAMVETGVPVAYQYDLGDLWLRKTGHPWSLRCSSCSATRWGKAAQSSDRCWLRTGARWRASRRGGGSSSTRGGAAIPTSPTISTPTTTA